jgi:hypothetical protein
MICGCSICIGMGAGIGCWNSIGGCVKSVDKKEEDPCPNQAGKRATRIRLPAARLSDRKGLRLEVHWGSVRHGRAVRGRRPVVHGRRHQRCLEGRRHLVVAGRRRRIEGLGCARLDVEGLHTQGRVQHHQRILSSTQRNLERYGADVPRSASASERVPA